jgi:hypothetical protein
MTATPWKAGHLAGRRREIWGANVCNSGSYLKSKLATVKGFGGFPQGSAGFVPKDRLKVNLSAYGAIPTRLPKIGALHFQPLENGNEDALHLNRRSGAQRGAPEKKLRPEVFLSAPCIFQEKQPSPLTYWLSFQ